jgi:translation initiation factor 3 subunit A
LHDVLTAKKSRTWVKVLESIMLKYIDIAVDLKLHRHAKDGLHQYRNISQQQAPQSLEAIIQHLLKAGESRVAKAAKEARSMNLGKGKAVADLECEQTPEAIMLSTMTDEGDGDRSEREVLVPWLKFLWETYRSVLDILKTNSKLEKVYHQTAQRAFEFCVQHERKTEMRRLCETLRHHLSNLQRATAQGNTNRLRGWEGWTQEGIELHLATRFAQLEAASAQELWTEGFRTVEDIHQVMRISKKPPKAKLMAKYYERLTKIFWVSGNYLFHAYAWWRHAQLAKESQKRPPPVEDQIQMACSVLLSALAIPDASDGAPDEQGLGQSGDPDDVDAEKMARMATLLGFRGHPTRAALLAEIAADDELVDVFGHDLPAHVRALHEALENTFAPRKLAGTVAPLLKELKEATPRLAHYAEPLARVAVSRVVAQLGRVYSVVTLDNFEQLVAPLAVPADDVEKLIVGAAGGPGGGASSGGALARVDHRLGVLRFPEEPQAAPASRHLGDLARYVAEAAQAARDHKPEEMRDPERAAKRARLFEMARAASARDHESALERKQVIERRKEEQESAAVSLLPFDVAATACPLDAVDATPSTRRHRRDAIGATPSARRHRRDTYILTALFAQASHGGEEGRGGRGRETSRGGEEKRRRGALGKRSQEKGAREAREDARRAPGPGGQGADEGPRQGRRRRDHQHEGGGAPEAHQGPARQAAQGRAERGQEDARAVETVGLHYAGFALGGVTCVGSEVRQALGGGSS